MKIKSTLAMVFAVVFILTQTVFAADENIGTVQDCDNMVSEMIASVPPEVFGGIYYNENGDLVLRIKDTGVMEASVLAEAEILQIAVEYTKYSLSELEAMKDSIEPYMVEYGILSIDANEAKGTIDVEISEENDKLSDILSECCDIDPEILRVSVSELSFGYTVASAPAESIPEEYVEVFGLDVSSALSSIAVPIYPGLNIAVNNSGFTDIGYSYGTAGPRRDSEWFYSAGHLVTGAISSPKVLVAANSDEIGRVGSYVFGSSGGISGDVSTIRVTSSSYELPTYNSLGSKGGKYTHTIESVMGASVEMWGAYSGISTGKVLATNQTLTVNGTTIKNLTKTNYTCKHGDSGAAVFSLNAAYDEKAKCYGIQSVGAFQDNATVSTYSYYGIIDGL